MRHTFFTMRDELSERLTGNLEGHVRSDATIIHVFKTLIAYGVYDRQHASYGYVHRDYCPVKILADECMLSTKSVRRALQELEEAGWIERDRRGSLASDIRLSWVDNTSTPRRELLSNQSGTTD